MLYECVEIDQTELDKPNESRGIVENYLNQKNDEKLEFMCFLTEQSEWDSNVIVIRKEEYDRFMKSRDEDDILDLKVVLADDFFNEFGSIVGIEDLDFDNCFVSAKYIDEKTYNSIELVIRVNGKEEIFIIDVE
jgi:hypothetical protein